MLQLLCLYVENVQGVLFSSVIFFAHNIEARYIKLQSCNAL